MDRKSQIISLIKLYHVSVIKFYNLKEIYRIKNNTQNVKFAEITGTAIFLQCQIDAHTFNLHLSHKRTRKLLQSILNFKSERISFR